MSRAAIGLRPCWYALSTLAAITLLAACGGSQPPIGAPDAMPQTSALATHADRGKSWMLPEAKSEDLLYVAASPDGPNGSVYAYSYPQGRLLGTLTGIGVPRGECADSAGDVFIVAYTNQSMSSSTIYEYAHGGTKPIAALSDPDVAVGCAVDPTTGDLAASGDGVAIFKNASGNPTMYYSSEYSFFLYCGYDDRSNLYLMGVSGQYGDQQVLVRLASGSSSFVRIALDVKLYISSNISPIVQWDGKHMAVTSDPYRKPVFLYRLHITGSSAKVISSATLTGRTNVYTGGMWIQGKSIIGVGYAKPRHSEAAFFWPYPKGGAPDRTIKSLGKIQSPEVAAVTVSVAPQK
jgi:hypothetical protein